MDWIVTNAGVAIPALVIVSGALGYILDRLISGKGKREDAESMLQTLEIKKRLDELGLSLDSARDLRSRLLGGRESISPAIVRALVEEAPEAASVPAFNDGPITFEETTWGMRIGMGHRLEALNNDISYLVEAIAHLSSQERSAALYKAQTAWEEYRQCEGDFARSLWSGGSGAPLLYLSRMIEVSEQRLSDLRVAEAEQNAL